MIWTFQCRSKPHHPGWAKVSLSSRFLKFQSIFPTFPQNFLIFFLTLALRVGESPTREGPGYATGPRDQSQKVLSAFWTLREIQLWKFYPCLKFNEDLRANMIKYKKKKNTGSIHAIYCFFNMFYYLFQNDDFFFFRRNFWIFLFVFVN